MESYGRSSIVRALAVYDDGSGHALYAGGDFVVAGGLTVNGIARWDGNAWAPLNGLTGPGVGGFYPYVDALAVLEDGAGPGLYVAGWFAWIGDLWVGYIARWDGAAWSALDGPLGTGTQTPVEALAVWDDGSGAALYAGGYFFTAGGLTVNLVARWDGTAWSALSGPAGTGVGGHWVKALGAHDDGSGSTLYLGGDFLTAGGVPSMDVAAWRCPGEAIFADGFEDGSTGMWTLTEP